MEVLQPGFTCQDFLPRCCESAGFFSKPVYEPFSTLILRANEWLQANRKWRITTCESVEFKYKDEEMDFNKMTFLEYGQASTQYIRGLRLWLTELENDQPKEQQIGYLNLVPEQLGETGCCSLPSFERLDVVVRRFNSALRINPLPGKVITIETQKIKLKGHDECDPERTYWVESGIGAKSFLFIIRIFYEILAENPGEIELGLKDFVPEKTASGGCFSFPKYELFSSLMDAVSDWCTMQWHNDLRICNIQSVAIKKSGGKVDPEEMQYIEPGKSYTPYVHILRIGYVRTSSHLFLERSASVPARLLCMSFVPEMIEKKIFSANIYEDLSVMKQKVSSWITANRGHVLSAETAALRIRTGGERNYGTEATFTYNASEHNEYWIFVIRLYIYVS